MKELYTNIFWDILVYWVQSCLLTLFNFCHRAVLSVVKCKICCLVNRDDAMAIYNFVTKLSYLLCMPFCWIFDWQSACCRQLTITLKCVAKRQFRFFFISKQKWLSKFEIFRKKTIQNSSKMTRNFALKNIVKKLSDVTDFN